MRRTLIPVFPGVQALDVTGPAEVFSIATRLGVAHYEIEIAAANRSPIRTSSGLELVPQRSLAPVRAKVDTLLVPSNQAEYLAEVEDRDSREAIIRDLMLNSVVPEMQAQEAGTAQGVNVQWTLGAVVRSS